MPWQDSLFYELHVRGMMIRHPNLPLPRRGTFAGLGSAPIVAHLKSLGVNVVELLPIHPSADEQHLVERGLSNYWGYNPFNFFAPSQRYLSSRNIAEFRTMVNLLHDAGIQVVLDVMFNHSGEGNHLGPTISFRGIDNASYYRLNRDDRRLLHGFHRLRQHAEPGAPPGAADGDGLLTLLGRGDAGGTASASTSPPRLPARRTPIRRRAPSSPRCARTRCSPRSR